eukprot:1823867-Pleurochrysis_carterae.AAC.4
MPSRYISPGCTEYVQVPPSQVSSANRRHFPKKCEFVVNRAVPEDPKQVPSANKCSKKLPKKRESVIENFAVNKIILFLPKRARSAMCPAPTNEVKPRRHPFVQDIEWKPLAGVVKRV